MSGDDTDSFLDKTNVVAGDTFKARLAQANDVPPAVQVMIGPAGNVGKQYLITTNETLIGRSMDCQIYIDDRSLSRQHARLKLEGQSVTLVDLQSTNKTMVNNIPLAPMASHVLKNNDQIKTGNVIFRFLEKGSLEAITAQAMYEKAAKDALTGAFSKGALIDQGPEAWKRAEVLNEQLGLITFDIDHFKKINDTYGHPGGDYVLKELSAALMASVIRSSDFFARFGGEEFVLLLSATSLTQAKEVSERIRQTIESHNFVFDGKQIKVTVSVGAACKQPGETDWNALYNRADKAMYEAKQGGRNRVVVAS